MYRSQAEGEMVEMQAGCLTDATTRESREPPRDRVHLRRSFRVIGVMHRHCTLHLPYPADCESRLNQA